MNTAIKFRKVSIKGTKRWKDRDGKRHQETRTFWQTISPFNLNAQRVPKSESEILSELSAEREAYFRSQEGK